MSSSRQPKVIPLHPETTAARIVRESNAGLEPAPPRAKRAPRVELRLAIEDPLQLFSDLALVIRACSDCATLLAKDQGLRFAKVTRDTIGSQRAGRHEHDVSAANRAVLEAVRARMQLANHQLNAYRHGK